MLPDNPAGLFEDLSANRVPSQTMAFLNYYAPNSIYPNDQPVAALLLTAPPNGMSAGLKDKFVESEANRFSKLMGLERSITEMMTKVKILDPKYFSGFGAVGGALYGAPTKWWRSGPLHSPSYSSLLRPWLWRVGSSVHPGGGIPAVLGGTLISTRRLLRAIGN
jgi:phytoene desaturase